MNLNIIIFPNYEYTKSNDICLRAKVDFGTTCNYNCYFCYYKEKLKVPFKDKEIIKEEIQTLAKAGIKEFDFSGGEVSIHPDLLEIIEYANKFGKVSCLTNGFGFTNPTKVLRYIRSGLQEYMFSIHGGDRKSHNTAVGNNKAFDKILESIDIINRLNKSLIAQTTIRINTVINNDFDEVSYVNLINSDIMKHIKQINLLPLNYWDDAINNDLIDYNIVSDKIKYIIDNINYPIEINVRYIPYCFMYGYEKYVVNTYQHIFDKSDWNLITYNVNRIDYNINKENMFEQAFKNRLNTYQKPRECIECSRRLICDGIEKVLIHSNNNLVPVPGEYILDVNHFRESDPYEKDN